MPTPRFLKDLPFPLHWLWRPWSLIALGLHILVFSLPLAPDQTEETEPELDSVAIVELPPSIAPTPPTAPSSVSPFPTPPPIRSNLTPPLVTSPPLQPTPAPVLQPSTIQPPVVQPPVVQPPTVQPSVEPSSSPPIPSPIPSSPPVEPLPYANFPHVPSAQGCQGIDHCWQTSDTQWRSIATTLQDNLKSQGYQLKDITEQQLGDITGRRIYEVTRDGAPPYYLNLISTLDQRTVYRMTDAPLTAEEMNAIATAL